MQDGRSFHADSTVLLLHDRNKTIEKKILVLVEVIIARMLSLSLSIGKYRYYTPMGGPAVSSLYISTSPTVWHGTYRRQIDPWHGRPHPCERRNAARMFELHTKILSPIFLENLSKISTFKVHKGNILLSVSLISIFHALLHK